MQNLHRAHKKPDWDSVKRSDRNVFQKVSAATRGILSPANVITVIGLAAVVTGLDAILNGHIWVGLVLLAVGRLLDIVDGAVADMTMTKSPLGEAVDATSDKIGTLLTIIVLFVGGITYWWVILVLLIPQLVIAMVVFYKKHKGIAVHPTLQGKFSMASAWIGIVGLLVVKALGDTAITPAISSIVYVTIGVSFALSMYALWQYSTGKD